MKKSNHINSAHYMRYVSPAVRQSSIARRWQVLYCKPLACIIQNGLWNFLTLPVLALSLLFISSSKS